MSFDTAGRTMMGTTATEAAERLGPLQPAALGANCGNNIADTEAAAVEIRAALPDVPVIFKPNAGIPRLDRHHIPTHNASPETLAAHAHRAVQAGVRIVGGCCGTTPEHIAAIAAVLAGDQPVPEIPELPGDATAGRRRDRRHQGSRRRRRT